MPIYAYRCEACGFAKDVLQKVSDPQLTICLSCSAPSFKKQLTAAGFQLKGTGWYATDFRNGGKPAVSGEDAADKPATEKVGTDAATSDKGNADKGSTDKGSSDKGSSDKSVDASKPASTSGTANTTAGASSATPISKV